jgi:subtilisin family serine protease
MRRTIKTGLTLAMAASMVVSGVPTSGAIANATENNAVAKLSENTNELHAMLKNNKGKAKIKDTKKDAEYAKGEAVIMYYSDVISSKSVNKKLGAYATIKNTFEFKGVSGKTVKSLSHSTSVSGKDIAVSVVKSDKYSTEELIKKLSAQKNIIYAEPNYKKHALATDDSLSKFQWALDNKGQFGGTEGLDTNADSEEIKNNASGEKVIAIIDTGVDYTHEDLADVMWVNNLKNDKLKGKHGYDFVNYDKDPMDDHGHGSHCAGIARAVMDNETGIAGVAKADNIKIMALKFLDEYGFGDDEGEIGAFNYIYQAQKLGVDIAAINCSYGGGGPSEIMETLIDMVGEQGALVIAAAGNEYNNNDVSPSYPASYDSDYIVSVAATNEKDEIASFSNVGAKSVDLAAPGTDILSSVCYDCFNPVTYDEEKINDVTSTYYSFDDDKEFVKVLDDDGFDAEAFEANEDAIPWGFRSYDVPSYDDEEDEDEVDETEGTDATDETDETEGTDVTDETEPASVSMEYSDEEFFGAKDNNKSLKVSIKNAKEGKAYEVAIPYKVDSLDTPVYEALSFKGIPDDKKKEAWVTMYDGTYDEEEKLINAENLISYDTISNENNYWDFFSVPVGAQEEEDDDYDYEDDEDWAKKLNVANHKKSDIEDPAGEEGEETEGEEGEEVTGPQTRFMVINVEPYADGDYEFYLDAVGVSKEGVDSSEFGKYDFYNGTSMATPHVTGAAAVVAAMFPEKSNTEIKDILLGSTRSNDNFAGKMVAEGTLDFSKINNLKGYVKSADINDGKLVIEGKRLDGSTVKINDKKIETSENTDSKIVADLDKSLENKTINVSVETKTGTINRKIFNLAGKKLDRVNGKGININPITEIFSMDDKLLMMDFHYGKVSIGTVPDDITQPVTWETKDLPNEKDGFEYYGLSEYGSEELTYGWFFKGYYLMIASFDVGFSETYAILAYDVANNKWSTLTEIPKFDWMDEYSLVEYNNNLYYLYKSGDDEVYTVYKVEGDFDTNGCNAKLVNSNDLGEIPSDVNIYSFYNTGDKLVSLFNYKYNEESGDLDKLPNYIFDGKEWKQSKATCELFDENEETCIVPVEGGVMFIGSAADGLGDIYTYDVEKDEFIASEYVVDRKGMAAEGYDAIRAYKVKDRVVIIAAELDAEGWFILSNKYDVKTENGKTVLRKHTKWFDEFEDEEFEKEIMDKYANGEFIQMSISLKSGNDEGKTVEVPTTEAPTTAKNPEKTTTVPTTTVAPTTKVPETTTAAINTSVGKTAVSKVTRKGNRKKAKLTLKKLDKVSGYQVKYSTSKKFDKKSTKTVDSAKNVLTIKNLKAKKKYYVKARAYVITNGKKNFGKWSKVKKIK